MEVMDSEGAITFCGYLVIKVWKAKTSKWKVRRVCVQVEICYIWNEIKSIIAELCLLVNVSLGDTNVRAASNERTVQQKLTSYFQLQRTLRDSTYHSFGN
jgi:hypothetical protein